MLLLFIPSFLPSFQPRARREANIGCSRIQICCRILLTNLLPWLSREKMRVCPVRSVRLSAGEGPGGGSLNCERTGPAHVGRKGNLAFCIVLGMKRR